MGFKLTGPLGPVFLPADGGKVVLGRRTHQRVHKDKLCSRNQIEIVVEGETVYATPVGVNKPRLTAKGAEEPLELKPNKRYVIHLGDKFTLYSGEFPFMLEKSKDGEEEELKRKHEAVSDDEGDEKPKKKAKKSHGDDNPTNKPLCKFGAKCYRTNIEHLEQFHHPTKDESAPASPSKPKAKAPKPKDEDNEGGASDGENEEYKDLKWGKFESLLILDNPANQPADKIVSFDMDDTLIKTRSGNVFAKGRDDWQWKFPGIPKKLKSLYKDGYRVVIFTNQAGVGTGTTKADDIRGKINDMQRMLGVPLVSIVATEKDKYRKPSPALWEHFVKKMNGGVTPSEALFVGDAAGRSSGEGRPKKDHSASDRAFAANVGIEFQTPEEYFLGEDEAPYRYDSFDPKTLLNAPKKTYDFKPNSGQELIVLVGCPASGKSTFATKKLVPKGYVHINQDTLKTKDKCIKQAKIAMNNGDSVVVDNTNPSVDVRAEYLGHAKLKNIPARCFYFDTSPDLAGHLNKYRSLSSDRDVVPGIAYNMYKSKFEIPTEDEGFDEVVKIKFVPEFDNKSDEKLFYKFM